MMQDDENTGVDYTILFLATLFFLHGSSFIAFHTPAVIWAGVVTLLFLFLVKECSQYTNCFIYLLPIVVIEIIWDICRTPSIGDIKSIMMLLSRFMQFAILPLLTYYLFEKNNIRLVLYIFFVFCIVEITTGISTIRACAIDPELARMHYGTLRTEDPEFYAYRMNLNVGNYHTSYGFTAMLPIVIMFYKHACFFPRPVFVKLFSLFSAVVMIYTVISASYTLSLLVCSVMALTFLCPSAISKSYFFTSLLLMLNLAYVFRTFLPSILYYLADSFDSEIMSARLYDLADSLNAGQNTADVDSDFNLRMECYTKSWNSFLSNPIIGSLSYKDSGGHSYILDNLGLMGLFGVGIMVNMWKTIWRRYISIFNEYSWFYYYGYALIAILIFFAVNPDGMEEQLLFFYPISGYILAHYTNTYEC